MTGRESLGGYLQRSGGGMIDQITSHRGFVWNRLADGLRAFGFDFGRFAIVVLLDSRDE